MKKIFGIVTAAISVSAAYAQSDGWGAPSDNAAAWGGRTNDLNPIAPRNVDKIDQ